MTPSGRGPVWAWEPRGQSPPYRGAWEGENVGTYERMNVRRAGMNRVGMGTAWAWEPRGHGNRVGMGTAWAQPTLPGGVGAWERGSVGTYERMNVGTYERGKVRRCERGNV